MRIIIREDVPCWYELSFAEKIPAIILKVHEDFVKEKGAIPENAPIIEEFKEGFRFKKFSGDFGRDFGFEGIFKFRGIKDGFYEFVIEIPKVKKDSGKKCGYCEGSGEDKFLGRKCLFCNGKGKEYVYDWQNAYSVSASFTVFSMLSYFYEGNTSCLKPQLLLVQTITHKDMHGGSLAGMYSVPLVKWLGSFGKHAIMIEMQKAMKRTYFHMFGKDKYLEHDFRAYVADNNGWLNVSCPGNACGLHPQSGYIEKDNGYEFSCHNVDTPMQQITLLAGLAALHDKARKEIK
ncbi:hypothetical protein KJ763_02750 [Patescibacteria group bacterium]|nr:hypothetical protein [Patescibacteria group bacterium]